MRTMFPLDLVLVLFTPGISEQVQLSLMFPGGRFCLNLMGVGREGGRLLWSSWP